MTILLLCSIHADRNMRNLAGVILVFMMHNRCVETFSEPHGAVHLGLNPAHCLICFRYEFCLTRDLMQPSAQIQAYMLLSYYCFSSFTIGHYNNTSNTWGAIKLKDTIMYTVVVEIRNAKRAGLVGPGIDKKKLGLVLPLSQLKRPVTPTEILCIFWKYFFLYTFHCWRFM